MTEFKDRLVDVIRESGCNKTKFADRLGISPAFLSQMCSGVRSPSDRTINDICEKFQINEDWLRNGTGPMKKDISRFDEISDLVSKALNGSNDFKKAVIQAICNRSDKELEVLDTLLREIYDNLPKAEPTPKLQVIKIAGRDGSFKELAMTSEEVKELTDKLEQLPEVPDDL